MVGPDSDRGDSRAERRRSGRRVDDVSRRDLETSSLASWSRALDEQRRELLAGVGHELKTPLSIVLGLCGRLLAAAELGDEQTEDVQRIRANAYVLLKRVEELLQVSRLDGGHLELEPRDVDVARLVRSSCEGFASVAEQREQRLVLEAPPRLPARVDEEKVLSVVSNLLANALKYAPSGGIVRCTVAERGRAAAHRGRRQRPGRGRRAARDDLRALPPRRRQRRAPGGHRPRPGDRARPRGAAQRHGHSTDAPEGGALFVVDLPVSVDRRPRRARGDPADDRRGRAPAGDGRAPARQARCRRAPRRAVARERARRRPREHPHRHRRRRARRVHRGAHRPPLRRRRTRPTRSGRPPDRRPAPRRRRARRGRRAERHRRAAPAPGRGAAA